MIAVFGVEKDWTNCLQVLLHGREIDFNSLVFSEDSSTLFTADSYSIKGWNLANGSCKSPMDLFFLDRFPLVMSFSHNGSHLAALCDDLTLLLWDVATKRRLPNPQRPQIDGNYNIFSHRTPIITFSWDASLVATTMGGRIAIWSSKDGKCSHVIEAHNASISVMAFKLDSQQLLSASEDGKVKCWDVGSGSCLSTLIVRHRVDSGVFSDNGQYSVYSNGLGTFKLDMLSQIPSSTMLLALSLASAPGSSKYAAWSPKCPLSIWRYDCDAEVQAVELYASYIHNMSFTHDAKWLAVAGRTSVRILDLSAESSPSDRINYVGGSDRASFAISSDASQIAVAARTTTIDVYDTSNGSSRALNGHLDNVTCLDFYQQQSEMLISGSWDKTVRLWNSNTGECLHVLGGHRACIRSVSLSQSGDHLLSITDAELLIWDTTDRCLLYKFEPDVSEFAFTCMYVAFSWETRLLATCVWDDPIYIRDFYDTKFVRKFPVPGKSITRALALSKDSKRLARADKSGRFWVLDIETQRYIFHTQCKDSGIRGFSVIHHLRFDTNDYSLSTNIGKIDTNIESDEPVFHGLSVQQRFQPRHDKL
jgi:WD40 repeat protein